MGQITANRCIEDSLIAESPSCKQDWHVRDEAEGVEDRDLRGGWGQTVTR